MLAKVNDRAMRQAAALNSQSFRDLLDMLHEEARRLDELLRLTTDKDQLLRVQGRSQEVHDLLSLIRTAPDKIDRNAPHPI